MISRIYRNVLSICCCTLIATSMLRAADEPARLPGLTIPDGLGVNIHFTDARPRELEMLAEGGFRFVRMDFSWSRTEQKPAQYDFSPYDRLLAALDKHFIRAVFILKNLPTFVGGRRRNGDVAGRFCGVEPT